MLHLPVFLVAAALSVPAPAAPAKPRKILFMPLVARNGASGQLGSGLTSLLAAALSDDKHFDVANYDGGVFGMQDPLVPGLARCPELSCAAELGARLHFDEVVLGVIDGAKDPRVAIWRVESATGNVLAMYEVALTDANLDEVTRRPERVLDTLVRSKSDGAPAPLAVATPASRASAKAAPPVRARRQDAPPPAADPPLRAGLRIGGGILAGLAGGLLFGALAVWTAYAVTLMYDMRSVTSTGRHVMTRRLARLADLGMGAVALGGLVIIPLAAGGLAAIAATWFLPS